MTEIMLAAIAIEAGAMAMLFWLSMRQMSINRQIMISVLLIVSNVLPVNDLDAADKDEPH